MRLQLRHVLLSWTISCTCSIALAPPAEAQSFFQKLFGFGGGSAAPPAAGAPVRSVPAYRFHNRTERRYQTREDAPEEDEIGPPDGGGPYRTMCVRTCDGFYFPLRHSALRRNFSSDVKSCRAACGDEARLYYYPENGGSVETMTDLAGRPYKEMPQAFAYRKALVSGCTCKPAPWSYEEASRHRSYAVAEAEERRQKQEQSTPPADKLNAQVATSAPQEPEAVAPANLATPSVATEATAETQQPVQAATAETTTEADVEPPAAAKPTPRRAERTIRRKSKARFARAKFVPTSSPGLFD